MLKKILILLNIVFMTQAFAKVTPSDVFVEARAIKIALASEVIQQKGVSLLPVIDIDLAGATPSSVYAMGSVLNYKLQVYARANNRSWKGSPFPNKKITPADVKELLLVVAENIDGIFGKKEFLRSGASGKKPADVMVQLTYANQWLDKLMPPIKPQYPYATLKLTQDMLERIYTKFDLPRFEITLREYTKLTPNDVFINVTSTYNLLRNMKLIYSKQSSPSHPYNITSGKDKIIPIDIFTITLFNLFFLYTASVDLNIDAIDTTSYIDIQEGIKPDQVFREADLLNSMIANLIASGGKINVQ